MLLELGITANCIPKRFAREDFCYGPPGLLASGNAVELPTSMVQLDRIIEPICKSKDVRRYVSHEDIVARDVRDRAQSKPFAIVRGR